MNTIYIDFVEIGDYEDFYNQIKEKLDLPEYFGDNLDSLSDCISGYVELPLHIELINMSVEDLENFDDLLVTLEELEHEVDDFSFSYFLEQYEDY